LERYDQRWLADAFGDVKDATEAGFFPPKLSSRCKTCSVNRFCRAFGGDLAHTVES
jgi:CRISPR/Cas system-associated exonuclease Cas4 (RecB family)